MAKVGIIFNLFFSTPANYAGLRISLFELIWGNSNITNTKNVIVTIIILSLVVTTGALYDQILEYIELLGGFCSVIYCVLIPGLIYVKNYDKNFRQNKNNDIDEENNINNNDKPKEKDCSHCLNILTVIVLIILTLIGYTSGVLTILFNMVKIKH